MNPADTAVSYSKADSWKIFDAIYRRYDLVNRVLSLGLDVRWRKKLCEFIPEAADLKILDLATGTADVVITLTQHCPRITTAYGVDLSQNMLELGREKVRALRLDPKIILQTGDAARLSFLNEEFDMATMAFGIRNVENPISVLKEIFRVLKPNGRGVILEFSLPRNLLMKLFYLTYLKFIVPLIGGTLSGNFRAYFYLNRTIEKFPYGEVFIRMMKQCGFKNVRAVPLLFGIATIYCGEKL